MPLEPRWELPTNTVLDYFDLDSAAALGLSFGGYLVMRAAAHVPRISHVVAFDTFVKQAAIVNHIQAAFCSADKKNIDSLEDTSMHLIRALSIIFGFLALGEAVIHFTGMKLPGSIIGMALLFVSLHMKWVKAAWLHYSDRKSVV